MFDMRFVEVTLDCCGFNSHPIDPVVFCEMVKFCMGSDWL